MTYSCHKLKHSTNIVKCKFNTWTRNSRKAWNKSRKSEWRTRRSAISNSNAKSEYRLHISILSYIIHFERNTLALHLTSLASPNINNLMHPNPSIPLPHLPLMPRCDTLPTFQSRMSTSTGQVFSKHFCPKSSMEGGILNAWMVLTASIG